MKIICAGFPKTGTKTLNCALQELGLETFDFLENFWFFESQWNRIFYQGGTTEDFQRMFQNVDSVTDFPCCYFWEEIFEAFPNAKIVLTYREDDDVDDWFKSMRHQVSVLSNNFLFRLILAVTPSGQRMSNFMGNVGRITFGETCMPRWRHLPVNETLMKKAYSRHYSYALQKIPANQLLIFKCSQGWRPLCEFLNLPIPNKPFPHKNIRGAVLEEAMTSHPFMLKMKRELVCVFAVVFAVLASITAFFAS